MATRKGTTGKIVPWTIEITEEQMEEAVHAAGPDASPKRIDRFAVDIAFREVYPSYPETEDFDPND